MTATELNSQRAKAAAHLELLLLKARAGQATPDQVAQARQVVAQLNAYRLPEGRPPELATSAPVPDEPAGAPAAGAPAGETFTTLLGQLTAEKAAAHRQMCLLANQLAAVPDDANCKELVEQIQDWKAQRNELGAKIHYLKVNGHLPEPAPTNADVAPAPTSAFVASLPMEKYALAKLLKDSILPNLSKARARLAAASTPTKQQHYRQKIARLELEASLVRSRMNALS